MTKFSIVIPAYNAEKSIQKCLDSILVQTFSDFEIVVINDGSKDSTLAILREYLKKTRKLRVYSFENSGVSITRQRGINLSNGEYIILVDSDDTVNPDLLEKLYTAICEHNNPDIIRYQAKLLNDCDYKDHDRYNFFDDSKAVLSGLDALKEWSIPGKKYAVYWLFAFKRSTFSNVLFFPNLKCHEDLALIPLLVAASNIVVTLSYIGYNYTCNNPGSITNTKSKEAERSRAKDFVKAYKYATQNFARLFTVSPLDYEFFVSDFDRRLLDKYNSLSEELKEELAELFGIE